MLIEQLSAVRSIEALDVARVAQSSSRQIAQAIASKRPNRRCSTKLAAAVDSKSSRPHPINKLPNRCLQDRSRRPGLAVGGDQRRLSQQSIQ